MLLLYFMVALSFLKEDDSENLSSLLLVKRTLSETGHERNNIFWDCRVWLARELHT